MTIVPRTSEGSASSAPLTTAWYQPAKSSLCFGRATSQSVPGRSGREREIRPRLTDGGVPERPRGTGAGQEGCSERRWLHLQPTPPGRLPLQGRATGGGEDSSRLPGRILPTPPDSAGHGEAPLCRRTMFGGNSPAGGEIPPKVQAAGLAGRCRRLSADALLAEIRRSEEAPSRAGRRPRPTRWGRGPPRPAPR